MSTSARMLRLLSLLQTHRFWQGSELAGRLAVSERTLRRDVERLRDLGYPVDASRGVAGGYQLRGGAAMPPLLLDDDEAVAIAVGLRTAATGSVAGIEESSVRALTKVIAVMPARLRRRVEAMRAYTVSSAWTAGPTVDAATLMVIAQACRDDERLRFAYTTAAGDRTERLVEPHRLVSHGRRWYLVAWDAERHDWRTFRADRLAEARSTGAKFRQRDLPGGDAAAFVRDRFAAVPTRYHVVVIAHAPIDHVRPILAQTGGRVEPVDETSCRVLMDVDDLDWPAFVLGAVGRTFDVVEPPELRTYLRELADRYLTSTDNR